MKNFRVRLTGIIMVVFFLILSMKNYDTIDGPVVVADNMIIDPIQQISHPMDETVSFNLAAELPPANVDGIWIGAGYSLEQRFYTEYLKLRIMGRVLETIDWQAGNPGFEAEITDADKTHLYLKRMEADSYPADWDLQMQDKLEYKVVSKYELRLKHNGTTCIFFKKQDFTEAQLKELDKLVNDRWVAQDDSNLSLSFSYFNLELYDERKASEDKLVFSAKTYFNPKKFTFDAVPDITVVNDTNPIWSGLEKEHLAQIHYQLSEDGKSLSLTCDGKEAVFENRKGER